MRRALAWAILLAQLASVAWHRGREEKYFCWAPYDEQTRFTVETVVAGRTLSPEETQRRYRFPAGYRDPAQPGVLWEQRAWGNMLGWVRRYEEGPGRADGARVTVRYSVNGRPEETWRWPR